ncbi:MAG: hypothetical protein R3D26_23430 [Cyanobacteriota/Melainabacteria group bacterium]
MSPLDMTVSESHPIKSTDSSAQSEESQDKTNLESEQVGYPAEMQPALILSICRSGRYFVFGLCRQCGDWSIFIVAGYCLFMLFYPLYQGQIWVPPGEL